MKNESKDKLYYSAVICTCIFRLMLQIQLPLSLFANNVEDDLDMVNLAASIRNGSWLGVYDRHVLEKPPGYSLLLALFDYLRLPYSFAYGVLYIVASLIFLFVIRKLVTSRWIRYIVFCIVLFSPVLFSEVGGRIYNVSVGPALTLLIVSSYIALYVECNNGIKSLIPWILSSSVFVSLAYLIRQDFVFLDLFAVGATIVIIVKLFTCKDRYGSRVKKSLCLAIPFVVLFLSVQLVCSINKKYYGLYTITDFTDTAFEDVCTDLMLIDSEVDDSSVYVTREAFDMAFDSSPTLNEIKPFFEDELNGVESLYDNGEIGREYYAWYIRWAASKAGIYNGDAVKTDAFFRQIDTELKTAFDNGSLPKRERIIISSMSPPLSGDEIGEIIHYSLSKGVWQVLTYSRSGEIPYVVDNTGEAVYPFIKVINQDGVSLPQLRDDITDRGLNGTAYYTHPYVEDRLVYIEFVSRAYRLLAIPVLVLAITVFFVDLGACIIRIRNKEKHTLGLWILQLGLLLALWVNNIIVAMNFYLIEEVGGNPIFYTGASYTLWHIFCAIAVIRAADLIGAFITRKKSLN